MNELGFGRSGARVLWVALLMVTHAGLVACSGGDAGNDDDDGQGGAGGEAGEGGQGGGDEGGKGGGDVGGQPGGGMGGDAMGGMGGEMAPPRPEAVIEDYAAPTGKVPVTLDFKTEDDLAKNFFVTGKVTQSADSGGVLKVAKGDAVVLTYDSAPDETRTDTFENFTATIKFHGERYTDVWFTFATDKNRNDGMTVSFNVANGQDGPPGESDVESIFYGSQCWAVSIVGDGPNCGGPSIESYGWTPFEPSMKPQTVKITVKTDKASKTIKVRGDYIDADGELIDHSVYTWTEKDTTKVNRINGEISFGLVTREADAFIDEISIKADEELQELPVVTLDDSPMHLWVPPGLAANAKLKGLIVVTPALIREPNGIGDFHLFAHLRAFASAWGWGLISGARGGMNEFSMFFKQDLDKLATKANRPELNTVPIFIQSLLNTLPYQALADEDFNKRIIGWHVDKPRTGGDLNAGMEESYDLYPMMSSGRAIPGFITYSMVSPITRRESGATTGWWFAQRFNGYMTMMPDFALWALSVHGPQTNAVVDSWMLYLAHLQELIKLRTTDNDGTTPLKPVDKSKGYLGLSDFFKLRPAAEVAAIEPFTAFPAVPSPVTPMVINDLLGNPQKDFIVGPATALVWQAWEYYRQKVAMVDGKNAVVFDPKKVFWSTVPRHGKKGESRLMKVGFDATLNGWKKLEFFDAASATPMTPLATVNAGGAAEYEYKNLSVGAHSFIARITGPDDKVHMTHPVMAVMAP